ncbi:MAG: SpoIIE family protein phosphatase [Acidobacteriota bacterium]|nr:SpoIIE family protein phosphatase [Acidobacteriota bacterium]
MQPASLIVVDPSGHRTRVALTPTPFRIGRQADNHLIVRDSRTSRNHAQIVCENGHYVLEDNDSRHGLLVNGNRVSRHELQNSDRVEFGVPDSYQLVFATDGAELSRLMDHFPTPEKTADAPGVKTETQGLRGGLPGKPGGNLAKLRAVLEVARTLQTSFSVQDVLNSVVDAALAVSGAERGFLLLRQGSELEMRCARDRNGGPLRESDLRVPRSVIQRALNQRRELLSMSFDPSSQAGSQDGDAPSNSVADLELRSVVCVPLLRIRVVAGDSTNILSTANDTAGVLYMDSRLTAADLSAGNRELLQTLAIEASTILENARLLEEERVKQKIEEELNVARGIQQSLLPRMLPSAGWFRAAGSSVASHQVGGDYFDVLPVNASCWATVVADVSGKGVSSALLASLLQGVFLNVSEGTAEMRQQMDRINRFLSERTGGGKYATIFYCLLDELGRLRYINAGHCAPIVVPADDPLSYLETTAMPVGLMSETVFDTGEKRLAPCDKVVIYSDGVTEAQSPTGEFFGRRRLRESILAHRKDSCQAMHDAIQDAVRIFTEGAPQSDDVTLVVVEYGPG